MVHNANVDRIFFIMQSQCCEKRDSFLRVVQSVSNILKVRDTLELESLEHLNLADINTKSVIVIAPSFFILIICRCWASNTFIFPIFCSNQKKRRLPAASAHFTLLCFSQF